MSEYIVYKCLIVLVDFSNTMKSPLFPHGHQMADRAWCKMCAEFLKEVDSVKSSEHSEECWNRFSEVEKEYYEAYWKAVTKIVEAKISYLESIGKRIES